MKDFPTFEKIETGIELNEDFIPNSNLLYDVYHNGKTTIMVKLPDTPQNKGCVGYDIAPKTLIYDMDKPLSEFTGDEVESILDYRGMNVVDDGFEAADVFMEMSHVTLRGIQIEVTMTGTATVKLEDGETLEDLTERYGDIYLHGAGENGYEDKTDLGGDITIKIV